MWLDGICKKCGSLILETDARLDMSKDAIESCADYKNMCLNASCNEHYWHYVGDQEELDYYEHDPNIDKRIIIKKN